jgi:hypothetical protein
MPLLTRNCPFPYWCMRCLYISSCFRLVDPHCHSCSLFQCGRFGIQAFGVLLLARQGQLLTGWFRVVRRC